MFSFVLPHPSETARDFAADLTLRWKKRLAQDAAYLANLIRISKDPRITDAAKLVQERQNALANAALDLSVPAPEKEALKQSLEAVEAELRRLSEEWNTWHRPPSDEVDTASQYSKFIGALSFAASRRQ